MKVTVLGSGSRGNSVLVEGGGVRLLVDAGFSGRDMERRLAAVEVPPDSVTALLITHDHGDHTRGMGVFARRWGVPLYMTDPTRAACAKLLDGSEPVRRYGSEAAVEVGGLSVAPFLTVHDAVDPIAVTVTERGTGQKLGIATDLGRATTSVRHALRGCDLLILESNHDPILLRESHYPWSVKSRIAGGHGHLSNRAAAELAVELHHPGLAAVVLAHLSEAANDPGLARDTVGAALERHRYRGPVQVAPQEKPLECIDVGALRIARQPPQLSLI
ncbi:MAG TPA: MBL fold metallo-hydrolase [Longimicrobiaceae bacterium]|nr:MBL fold metallo-hydrolase [Longimicrobiaceae bacterium]